jgi:hypothetical protein
MISPSIGGNLNPQTAVAGQAAKPLAKSRPQKRADYIVRI